MIGNSNTTPFPIMCKCSVVVNGVTFCSNTVYALLWLCSKEVWTIFIWTFRSNKVFRQISFLSIFQLEFVTVMVTKYFTIYNAFVFFISSTYSAEFNVMLCSIAITASELSVFWWPYLNSAVGINRQTIKNNWRIFSGWNTQKIRIGLRLGWKMSILIKKKRVWQS